jgi:hypothetical protein
MRSRRQIGVTRLLVMKKKAPKRSKLPTFTWHEASANDDIFRLNDELFRLKMMLWAVAGPSTRHDKEANCYDPCARCMAMERARKYFKKEGER